MPVVFSNDGITTLGANITSSATTITVADGSVFPSLSGSEYFYVTLEDVSSPTTLEIVKVTARSGNSLTVVRAQDNTSASAFDSGDRCELRVCAALLNDINEVTTAKINDSAVTTAKINDSDVTTAKINDSAVTTAKIADDNVSLAKLANMATASLLGRNTSGSGDPEVLSAATVRSVINVADGSTANQTDAHLLARANHSGTQAQSTIVDLVSDLASKVDGVSGKALSTNDYSTTEKNKLAGIEAGAEVVTTARCTAVGCLMDTELDDLVGVQTLTLPNATNISSFGKDIVGGADSAAVRVILDLENSDIKSYYEANSDTNSFTDADHTKLNGIEVNATQDQSAGEIKTAYESNSDTNAFTDAILAKINGIENSATSDQSNSEIETAYNAQVAQVSSSERNSGNSSTIKRFAPADVKSMIDTHAGSAFTGDVSISNGNTSINNSAVTLAKIASISKGSIIGRISDGVGSPQELSSDQALSAISHTNDCSRIVFAKCFSNTFTVIYNANNITIAWDASTKQIKYQTAIGSAWGYLDGSHLFVPGSNNTTTTTPLGFSDDITATQDNYQYISNTGSIDTTFSLDDAYGAVDRFTLIKEGYGGSGYPSFEGMVFIGATSHVTIVLREISYE